MNLDTWTVAAKFSDGSIEEVDVQAIDEADAREKGAVELAEGYMPGWEIISVTWRAAAGWMFG